MRDVAELDLDALPGGELDAETFAPEYIFLRNLDTALGEAEPAHAVREARRSETDLRHTQAVAFLHQHVFLRHFEAVIFDLAMTAVLLRTHDRDAAHDAPARLVLVIEERGQPAPRIVRRARHYDVI